MNPVLGLRSQVTGLGFAGPRDDLVIALVVSGSTCRPDQHALREYENRL